MDVELSKRTLFWEMKEAVEQHEDGEKVDFTEVDNGIKELLQGAESCQEMINDRKKISDEDFYSKLKEFAYIAGWDYYDRFKVLEMAYNNKFVDETTIKTTMHAVFQKTEGHGRDFSWWDEEVGINFKVLYTEDFEADDEHFYTPKEIKKLIAERKIVIVSEEERNLAWEEDTYKKEKYQKFDYAYDDYNMQYEFFSEGGKFYEYTLKHIKKELGSKQLKKLFAEHLDHVEVEVYEATDGGNYGDGHWSHVAKKYSERFKEQGYAKKLTKLRKARNNIKK